MKKKNINIFIVLGVLILLFSTGVLSNLFSTAPAEDSCTEARAQYATIACDVGDEVEDTVQFGTGGTILCRDQNDCDYYSTPSGFKVDGLDSKIVTSYGTGALPSFFGLTTDYVVFGVYDADGALICQVDSREQNTFNACDSLDLTRGHSYDFKITEKSGNIGTFTAYAKVKQTPLWLYYQSPDTGGRWGPLPSSRNCIIEGDWTYSLKEYTLTEGRPADDQTRALSSGLESQTGINQDRSVSMVRGESTYYLYAYREVAPIATAVWDGKKAVCDPYKRKLYGYTKLTSIEGNCWAIPDDEIIFVDGLGKQFCCNTEDCRQTYSLSSDYVCENYICTYGGTPTNACNVRSDCEGGSPFTVDGSGQTYKSTWTCDTTKPQGPLSGTCVETRIKVGCDPTGTYTGSQCCYIQADGSYKLEQCVQTLSDCSALGANYCCLGNTAYTEKSCTGGLKCCGSTGEITEGIGTCKDKCVVFGEVEEVPYDLSSLLDVFGTFDIGDLKGIPIFIVVLGGVLFLILLLKKSGGGGTTVIMGGGYR